LAILYVLYSCYATAPLENNPFLTFFLQLLEELPPMSVEQHFVYCILEETLSRVSCIQLPVIISLLISTIG
jgi:hypothetical protein